MSNLSLIPQSGFWNPVWQGSGGQSGQVYSNQTGRYTRIGNTVHLSCTITLTTLGTITGTLRLGGLPFPSVLAGARSSLQFGFFGSLGTAVVNIFALVPSNVSYADIYHLTVAAATPTNSVQATLSATADVVVSGRYECA